LKVWRRSGVCVRAFRNVSSDVSRPGSWEDYARFHRLMRGWSLYRLLQRPVESVKL
jgi:hypothetical protein